MLRYRPTLTISLTLCAAVSLAACSAGQKMPSSRTPPASLPVTSPGSITAQTLNDLICRQFTALAPSLTRVLETAQADPASLGSTPGAGAALKRAASLLQRWSGQATTSTDANGVSFLPIHLLLASDELNILTAGYGDPNAASYATGARNDVAKVTADCASQAG